MCASRAKDKQESRNVTSPPATLNTGRTTDHVAVQPGILYLVRIMADQAPFRPQKTPARTWILATFVAVSSLYGCAAEPFVDGRREAGSTRAVGPSGVSRVAICYNGRSTTPEAVWQLAESECAKTDRVPRYERQEGFACSIANPTRIFFRCVAPSS